MTSVEEETVVAPVEETPVVEVEKKPKRAPITEMKTKPRNFSVSINNMAGSITVQTSKAPLKKRVTIADDAAPKVDKPKRKTNTNVPRGTVRGLFIGSARVKNAIYESCLNREVCEVCKVIEEAREGRSVTNKKTGVTSVVKTPVKKISEQVQNVYKRSESLYMSEMTDKYTAEKIKAMKKDSPERHREYKAFEANEGETVVDTNKRFDPTFYNDFATYYATNDKFALGATTKPRKTKTGGMTKSKVIDEWYRAIYLIKKTAYRMSANSSRILAAFLDQIAEQLCIESITACIDSKHKTVAVEHAIRGMKTSNGINNYIQTLRSYHSAIDWLAACDKVNDAANEQRASARAKQAKKKGENREHISVKVQLPEYPKPVASVMFNSYVVDIFRAAKFTLRDNNQGVSKLADKYFTSQITSNFREMTSFVIFETTERISKILRAILEKDNTRTVTDTNMYHAINLLLLSVGIDAEPYVERCQRSVERFSEWHATNCDSMESRMRTMTSADQDEEEEDDEDDEDDIDEEEVEEEVEAEPVIVAEEPEQEPIKRSKKSKKLVDENDSVEVQVSN